MPEKNLKDTVYIKRLETYDRDAIREIVKEGMRELKFQPAGKVFVKPNGVVAHKPEFFDNKACTTAAVVGETMAALSEAPGVARIDLGENSAVGIPTRLTFKYAGYYDEVAALKKKSRVPVDIFCIDEERRDPLFVGGVVHDVLRVGRRMARADCKVYVPRLKCHCVSNMTGAVKLNVGICSDDERAIRHDFMLDDKIVDLLAVGYPDFTVMDAIEIGVGNEAFPILRKLGLILMGKNPVAVDLVGARLLGYQIADVPYLKRAIERGYTPKGFEEVALAGDLKSWDDIDQQAKRVQPYDDEFHRWQDVSKELKRLQSPMRFFWGPYSSEGKKCLTGCVMGIKMWLATFEQCLGPEAFTRARPVVFVIGNVEEEIDVKGSDAFLFGSCAKAKLKNARKVIHVDKCFTTASDMTLHCGMRLGMRAPIQDSGFIIPSLAAIMGSTFAKVINLRYAQDIGYFMSKRLERKL